MLGNFWRYLSCLVGGALLPLSFSPFNLPFAVFISIAILLIAVRKTDRKVAFFSGWVYGIGVFGMGVWWIQVSIHQFGMPYWVFSVGLTVVFISLMALYFAFFAFLLSFFNYKSNAYFFVAPSLWLAIEFIRSKFASGFPWLLVGYSQVDSFLKGWVPVIGALGCSGLVVFIVGIFIWLLPFSLRKFVAITILTLMVFVSGSLLEEVEWTANRGADLEVVLVQGAIEQEVKWDSSHRKQSIQRYLALTEEHWGADVIVWPETALTTLPEQMPELMGFLQNLAEKSSSDFLVGIPTRNSENGEYYNSLLKLGENPDQYSKRKLVPYGEYFPGKELFGWFDQFLLIPMSDLSPGGSLKDSIVVQGIEAGILICYEIAFKKTAFSSLPAAGFIVNISNDAWFGDTSAPFQHLQIARIRALESGRSIVRATNNGITAIINHRGLVLERGPQFIPAVIKHKVPIRSGSTPYVLYGDLPAFAISSLIIFIFLFCRLRQLINFNN